MIKIKEYPPVIDIKTIMKDRLVGAKSYATVVKRLKKLKVRIHIFDIVETEELFNALVPDSDQVDQNIIIPRKEPFKLS